MQDRDVRGTQISKIPISMNADLPLRKLLISLLMMSRLTTRSPPHRARETHLLRRLQRPSLHRASHARRKSRSAEYCECGHLS